jgi:hypothetical protein
VLPRYRDAVGQILAQQVSGSTPARISAEIEEVASEEQLAVARGASVTAPAVKAGFNFSERPRSRPAGDARSFSTARRARSRSR